MDGPSKAILLTNPQKPLILPGLALKLPSPNTLQSPLRLCISYSLLFKKAKVLSTAYHHEWLVTLSRCAVVICGQDSVVWPRPASLCRASGLGSYPKVESGVWAGGAWSR